MNSFCYVVAGSTCQAWW